MGSIDPNYPLPQVPQPDDGTSSSSSDEDPSFTVLITGFAPFKTQFPINPSWEIARSLPAALRLVLPSEGHAAHASGGSARKEVKEVKELEVKLMVYPRPVRVSYKTVRDLVPKLWDGSAWDDLDSSDDPDLNFDLEDEDDDDDDAPRDSFLEAINGPVPPAPRRQPRERPATSSPTAREKPKKIDLMLHIGMAGPKSSYALERRGHRGVYGMPDVDGVVLGDESKSPRFYWEGYPEEIETDVDVNDTVSRWRKSVGDAKVRLSEDAGRYLCDFIYYSSLAHLWKRDEERRVVFLHVPAESDGLSISRGRKVAVELVRSVVGSMLAGREVQKADA